MMRAVLTLLCSLNLVGCVHINQGSRPMGSIMSRSETPQPGDWCRVTYPETRNGLLARQQYSVTGQVEAVDENGLHLSQIHGRYKVDAPIAERIPIVRRRFNDAVGNERDRAIQLDGTEIVEILSAEEAGRSPNPVAESQRNIAQQLVAAVPGRR